MKTHGSSRSRISGSFGIPDQMKEAHKSFVEKRDSQNMPPDAEGEGEGEEQEAEEGETLNEEPETAKETKSQDPLDFTRMSPRKALASVGITMTDEDFHSVLYRGFVEKNVELTPALGSVKPMVAKIKTLTPDEYNTVDELVAEDIESIKGTTAGFQVRRELWTVAFAVIEINGREIAKVKRSKDGEADIKELARERQKMLKQLSPAVINKIIRTVQVMGWAIAAIVEDPKANF